MGSFKSIHDGHRKRMRDRFSIGGFSGYQPHEVLEQLLFEAIPRGNTNEIAHMLIKKFGSLNEVFLASKEELMEVKGIGEKSAEFIRSVFPEIGRMMLEQFREADEITVYDIVTMMDWFISQCRDERVYAMIFNSKKQLLDFIPIEKESINDPVRIANVITSYMGAEIFYLVADNKDKVSPELLQQTESLTALDGCVLRDAFYKSMLGFVSVKNPDNILKVYKKPSNKSKI